MTAHPQRPVPHGARASAPRRVGGTLLGVFIGIVVGLGLAAAVAYWLMKNNPALPLPSLARDAPRAARTMRRRRRRRDRQAALRFLQDPAGRRGAEGPGRSARPAERGDRAVAEQAKDQLDRQGCRARQTARPAPPTRRGAAPKRSRRRQRRERPAKRGDRFWLQAGSFSTEPDAENLQARLALAGWEATVQQGSLADKCDPLPRPPRTLRQRRRARPDEKRAREARLRRRGRSGTEAR